MRSQLALLRNNLTGWARISVNVANDWLKPILQLHRKRSLTSHTIQVHGSQKGIGRREGAPTTCTPRTWCSNLSCKSKIVNSCVAGSHRIESLLWLAWNISDWQAQDLVYVWQRRGWNRKKPSPYVGCLLFRNCNYSLDRNRNRNHNPVGRPVCKFEAWYER